MRKERISNVPKAHGTKSSGTYIVTDIFRLFHNCSWYHSSNAASDIRTSKTSALPPRPSCENLRGVPRTRVGSPTCPTLGLLQVHQAHNGGQAQPLHIVIARQGGFTPRGAHRTDIPPALYDAENTPSCPPKDRHPPAGGRARVFIKSSRTANLLRT